MKKVLATFAAWSVLAALPAAVRAWDSISVPGDIYAENQWDTGAQPLAFDTDAAVWAGVIDVDQNGGFKFAADNSWDNNWGADYEVWRFPSVGTLDSGGDNIRLTALSGPARLRFTFDPESLRFSVAPPVTNAQLVGVFNNQGATDAGILENTTGDIWTAEVAMTSGDNIQLLVNGGDIWGPAWNYSAPAGEFSAEIAGGATAQIDDFRPGVFRVAFDAAALTLSVDQIATNEFETAGYAADGTLSSHVRSGNLVLAPNLEKNGKQYVGSFWISAATDFKLSFSARDASGNAGNSYWSAPSTSSVTLASSPVTETYTAVSSLSDRLQRTFKAQTPGLYRVSFVPENGQVAVQRVYSAAGQSATAINLFADPSFENNSGWATYNADVLSGDDAPDSHAGAALAQFRPLHRHDQDGNYGSVSRRIYFSTNAAGSTLRVSAWMRALGTWEPSRTRIWIEWEKDSDGNKFAEDDATLYDFTGFWESRSLEAVIPEGADRANVLFSFNGSTENDGYLLIDDAEARLVSSRSLDFDTWTAISGGFGAYSPDWSIGRGRTTNNLSDAHVEPGAVFISKYIEGSNNNKAVELYNASTEPVDLSGWTLRQYNNGATSPSANLALSGTVATGACFLITRPFDDPVPAADALAAVSDLQLSGLTFNGDDALVLVDASGNVADRVGQVRSDVSGSLLAYVMRDHTLVRSPYTAHGATNAVTDDFPYSEWEILPCDDFTGLKVHARSLPPDVYVPSGLSLVFDNRTNAILASPQLEGGIGDVSFWYRTAFPESAGVSGSATLVLEAAEDEAFSSPVAVTNLSVPSTQYDFRQFSVLVDRSDLSYFRIRQTDVSGGALARIDDLYVGEAVDISRNQPFTTWTNANWASYTGTYSLGGWSIVEGRTTLTNGTDRSPAALLPANASVVSPSLDNGIGEVRFWAIPADAEATSCSIAMEQSTDGGATWSAAADFQINNAAWINCSHSLGIASNVAVRFVSTGADAVVVDAIELRIPEGDSRNQDFNSWKTGTSYTTSTHQGWTFSSALTATDSGVGGTLGLRLKDAAGAYVQSAALSGGLGTLSFQLRAWSTKTSGYKVELSRNGGTSWTVLCTNRTSGASATNWATLSFDVNDETVTHVKISTTMSQRICLDNIVCGKITPPPSLSLSGTIDPAALRPDTSFRFVDYVNPVGSAAQEDITAVVVHYKFVVGTSVTSNSVSLSYETALGAWVSSNFPGLPDKARVVYSSTVSWTSNGVAAVSSIPVQTANVSETAGRGVWINEVFYNTNQECDQEYDPSDWLLLQRHEFVEICGPAGTDLTGWKLELQYARASEIAANGGKAAYATYVFRATNTLPSKAALKLSDAGDGYGFFVVGDAPSTPSGWADKVNVVLNQFTSNVNASAAVEDDHIHYQGVIVLRNPQNAVIDQVGYGVSVTGVSDIGKQEGFDSTDSLSATGGPGATGDDFDWSATNGVSIGEANANQSFKERESGNRGIPWAFHDPSRFFAPVQASVAPFFMLGRDTPAILDGATNYHPTIDESICFNVGFTNDWDADGLLYVRSDPGQAFDVLDAGLLESGQAVTNGVAWNFVRCTVAPYSFGRLETIEYFFKFDPMDSARFDAAYVALSEDGSSSAVYESEDDAADHPFSYTFPFHDEIWFVSLPEAAEILGKDYPFDDTVPFPSDPGANGKLVFFDPDLVQPPAPDELKFEFSTNLLDTAAWTNLPWLSIQTNKVGGDGHYYSIEFELPESPASFRIVPSSTNVPTD